MSKLRKTAGFNLAGCISLESKSSSFGFEWHDSLMPVGENYTALERAIFECACAGCESIWITIDDSWAPLIKHRVGDYVYDPVWYYRQYDVEPSESRKLIPIFCVPHRVKYRDRRDSLGWGIINSAMYANKATKNLSVIAAPDMFYASFCFGIYNPRELIGHRKLISYYENFYISHEEKTIKDGRKLGFTFSWEDVQNITKNINEKGTGVWKSFGKFVKGKSEAWAEKLPPEERYSARFFSLQEVFEPLIKKESHEISWFYEVEDWDSYRSFLASDKNVIKPKFLKKMSLAPVGENRK